MPRDMRLELLLEYSQRVAPLPDDLAADPARLERVAECQTPFFLALGVGADGGAILHFDAPPEAPTVRGFAGILSAALNGVPVPDLLAVPPDIASRLALTELISPLRLRGMSAIVMRLKRHATEMTDHPAQ